MSLPKGITVTLDAREPDLKDPKPEPFMYMLGKWERYEEALASEADAIAVAFPEVIGDTYSELIINLGKLAEHDKALVVAGPSKFFKSVGTL